MILFAKDWDRYPTAMPDFDTPNQSWVRFAKLLKSMGVKNHQFMLALHNQSLKGVNPHAENLPIEIRAAIVAECKINPWYFFREVAQIPGKGSSDTNSIIANRGNISFWWSFFNHVTYILIQPRQTGKTLAADMLITILMNVICESTFINLLTKDDKLRGKNISDLKKIQDALPFYVNRKTKLDANNTETLTVKALGNQLITYVPQVSEKLANNTGRGFSAPVNGIDEGPFQAFIAVAMKAMLAASGAAVDEARRKGTVYGTWLTTTAGRLDDPSGMHVYKLMQESADWSEAFYDAESEEHLVKLIRGIKNTLRVCGVFSHRQLGFDDDWLRDKIELSTGDVDSTNRDYLNLWTSGNLRHPLEIKILDLIRKSEEVPKYNEIDKARDYIMRWYIPVDEIEDYMDSTHCIVGCDTSEAVNKDNISIVVTDIKTYKVIAAATINKTNIVKFSQYLGDFLIRFKNTTLIIERKSTGSSVIDVLLEYLPTKGIDPFKRIFNWIVNNQEDHEDRFNEVTKPMSRREPGTYTRCRQSFGFATSSGGMTSRSDLYSRTLRNAVENSADRVTDSVLIAEILALEEKNNRVSHPKDGHDDMVIGWLLSHWFLTFGRHLSFYGINQSYIRPRSVTGSSNTTFDENKWENFKQQQVRKEIEDLTKRMSQSNDKAVHRYIEDRLRALSLHVEFDDSNSQTINELLTKLNDNKHNAYLTQTSGSRPADYLERLSQKLGFMNNMQRKTPSYGSILRRY